jgi:hypothetical protein
MTQNCKKIHRLIKCLIVLELQEDFNKNYGTNSQNTTNVESILARFWVVLGICWLLTESQCHDMPNMNNYVSHTKVNPGEEKKFVLLAFGLSRSAPVTH